MMFNPKLLVPSTEREKQLKAKLNDEKIRSMRKMKAEKETKVGEQKWAPNIPSMLSS
jgi:hypothetical protein